jgi:hypothetical protein
MEMEPSRFAGYRRIVARGRHITLTADPLQGPAQTQGVGLRDRQTINDAKGESRPGSPPRDHYARDAATERNSHRRKPAIHETGGRNQLPRGATPEGGSRRRRGFCCMRPTTSRLRFQPSRPAPSLPHQAPNERAENTGILRRRQRRAPPDPLENGIPSTPVISGGGIFELGDDTAGVLRGPSLLVVVRYLNRV